MYFLVNSSHPKPLDIATSNFAGAYMYVLCCRKYNILSDLDPKVKKSIFMLMHLISKLLEAAIANIACGYCA